MNKDPIFKKGHYYLNKDSRLVVLCTEDQYKSNDGWKGTVVLSSLIVWELGDNSTGWNSDKEWWTDLGSNEENIKNKEDI
jgi:hypothetical protein